MHPTGNKLIVFRNMRLTTVTYPLDPSAMPRDWLLLLLLSWRKLHSQHHLFAGLNVSIRATRRPTDTIKGPTSLALSLMLNTLQFLTSLTKLDGVVSVIGDDWICRLCTVWVQVLLEFVAEITS